MNIGHKLSMTTAAIALGLTFTSTAGAQSSSKFTLPTSLSYSSQGPTRQTWNTILLVSGVVLAVGLLQDESTLTILGGAGVIVSLVQLNQNNFQSNYFPRGLDMVRSGPVALGVNPFGQKLGFSQKFTGGFNDPRPSLYVTASFKF